ncbi:MAG: protein BatD, partial [Chlorobi bacterium]|nr:protein BatD [Chlorobiota bacterium]
MFTRASIAFLLIFALEVAAQQPTFTLTVDRAEVALGQQFAVTYTFSGGNPNKLSNFRQPDLNKDFLVRSGPNQSSNIQIINGKMSATLAFTFFVEPRKVGTFTVPAASIVYEGKKMMSNTATVKVVVGSRKPSKSKKEHKIDVGDAIFVRAFADKKDVYLGEQVTITYKLFTRVTVENYNVGKLPRMVGFWAEDFDLNPRRTSSVETVNGKQYRVFLLKKTALFPTQDGRLSIEPLKINVLIRVRQRRKTGDTFFDQFFNDPFFDRMQSREVEIASNKLIIKVRPLPEKNKPPSFHGAVGDFVMETKLDRDKVKANESITLTVKIRGKGNIKLLEPPELQVPNDVDHYDPRVEETITMGGGRMGGVKTFEYLLVPRYPGERIISPVAFSYYDLSSKRYV